MGRVIDFFTTAIFSNPIYQSFDGVRLPTYFRRMNKREKEFAKSVFLDTFPFDQVYICNGAGKNGRPFTLLLGTDYFINCGDDVKFLPDLSAYLTDQELLIHELTHVWQSTDSPWSDSYIFNSLWHQAIGDAYKYRLEDVTLHMPWSSFNVESQAQIVEDWVAGGQKLEDPRYRYVVEEIRNEYYSVSVRPLPHATLNVPVTEPSFDSVLLPLLKGRYAAPNSAEAVREVKDVEDFFKKLDGPQAKGLLARLKTRQNGDKVSASFYQSFNSMTVGKLLILLRDRVNA